MVTTLVRMMSRRSIPHLTHVRGRRQRPPARLVPVALLASGKGLDIRRGRGRSDGARERPRSRVLHARAWHGIPTRAIRHRVSRTSRACHPYPWRCTRRRLVRDALGYDDGRSAAPEPTSFPQRRLSACARKLNAHRITRHPRRHRDEPHPARSVTRAHAVGRRRAGTPRTTRPRSTKSTMRRTTASPRAMPPRGPECAPVHRGRTRDVVARFSRRERALR